MSVIPARIFVREGDGWMRADDDGQGNGDSALNNDYFYQESQLLNPSIVIPDWNND